jgi:predicted dehydrogenase
MNTTRLAQVIAERKAKNLPLWENTEGFTSLEEMLDRTKPTLVFIGVPPFAHGHIEELCAERDIDMFIEKPLSCQAPAFVENLRDIFAKKPNLLVSVGYMLRYHKALDFIKDFLTKNHIKPVSICARYNSAYVSIPKPTWWDVRTSGGPVVEQGTHFCDLARYIAGDVDMNTVSSVVVPASSPVGTLSKVPPGCEEGVPMESRINRATSAHFKFTSGAVGILQHALLMKGERYFTEFEIWCDGYVIRLVDPYSPECYVEVFDSSASTPTVHHFNDDPYLTEDRIFLEAAQTRDFSKVKSLYSDAVETYRLSYVIQNPK